MSREEARFSFRKIKLRAANLHEVHCLRRDARGSRNDENIFCIFDTTHESTAAAFGSRSVRSSISPLCLIIRELVVDVGENGVGKR